MPKYASRTEVEPEQSRQEIEAALKRYGASAFGYGEGGDVVMVQFKLEGRLIRKLVKMPREAEFMDSRRTQREIGLAHAQAIRQRWRALLLSIKSRLEEIDSGIATVEQAFMSDIVIYTGDGRDLTVGQ